MNLNSVPQYQQVGYYMLDHRNAPGLPDDVARAAGLPMGGGRGLLECDTSTCSHCQTIMLLPPANRVQNRYVCSGCSHVICDACAAIKAKTGLCRTFAQVVDEILTQADARQAEGLILLP